MFYPVPFKTAAVQVGTTAVQFPDIPTGKLLLVKADPNNSGTVWLSSNSGVNGTNPDGIPLRASEWVWMPVNNAKHIYAVSSSNNQKVYIAAGP